jgi:hypothetical protein
MKFKYPKYTNVTCDNELPPPHTFALIIDNLTGATYPEHILTRRVNMLKKKEVKKCISKWRKIRKMAQQMENIIANRAEIEEDEWE